MAELTPEMLRSFTELLSRRIGLNAESVGKQTLSQAVAHRLAAVKTESAESYRNRIDHDPQEWQEFLEEIVVPESWFFREKTPFECLRSYVKRAWDKTKAGRPLRLLSIPCSRGEEPYSMALTLLDSGLAPHQFSILACDLSERSIRYAQTARYRAIAFRETDETSVRLTQRYFQKQGEEMTLAPEVRACVNFRRENLAASDFLKTEQPFDVIFCRNVLIYLTEEVRSGAIRHFRRLLTPYGILYFGHSECRLGQTSDATQWDPAFAAAYTWGPAMVARASSVAATEKTLVPPRKPAIQNASRAAHRPYVGGKSHIASELPVKPQPVAAPRSTHSDEARRLADSGRLDEAEALCRRLIDERPADPELFCLLGVIRQAGGRLDEAESHFQKSLYLAPDHEESLVHMLLLCRLRGDATQVANYERRLNHSRRAENRS